jgi:hypothetical protein
MKPFLQLGPLPAPPPSEGDLSFVRCLVDAIPFFMVGCLFLAMFISLLLRYSETFREFWAKHICAFIEEHGETEEM